jgi:hypothetical protein
MRRIVGLTNGRQRPSHYIFELSPTRTNDRYVQLRYIDISDSLNSIPVEKIKVPTPHGRDNSRDNIVDQKKRSIKLAGASLAMLTGRTDIKKYYSGNPGQVEHRVTSADCFPVSLLQRLTVERVRRPCSVRTTQYVYQT